ncbi:unnamed protein product [Schistosoma curassoni]|uniref:PHD-type domain-containing protein n=1 Tax=Schistosoma curassoni TaxID=6186 RepID=A0A183KLS2_9TREM|nr:unnamed protein product [Schistosoma curassoni]
MALNPQYSHTTTPIIEAWLIKALRLVHSKKSSDRDKLRKFYKEACENEAQVVHMTIAEALREPRECITTNYESNDRDTSTSTHSTQRTRVAQSVNDPSQSTSSFICTTTTNNIVTNESMSSMNTNSSGTSMFTTTSTSNPDQIISSTTTATTNNNITSGIPTSPVIGTTTHSSNSTTNRANKRNKVAFFNIFDVASSTPNNSSISNTPIVSKNNTAQRSLNQLDNTLSIESVDFSNTTIQLCTISSINDDNQEITTDSVIGNTGTTNNISMHSNLSNPIIDLTFTDNETASVSSSLAINTTTSANTVAVTLPLSEDKQMATGKVMNPPTMNTTTTSTIITTPTTYIPTVSSVSLQPPSLSSPVVTVIGALTKSTQDNSSFNTNTTTTTTNNNNNNARLLAASLVADLVCRLCGRLSQQPQLEPDNKTLNANVLVECIKCGSLYHQLCHQPLILMSTPKQQWLCINCSITTTTNTTIFNPSFVSSVSSLTSSISCTATSSSNSSLTTLAISANSTCVNSMSADPMIPCSVIQSDGDILSKDVTMITDNNNNNEYSFSSSTHHSSVVLSNPVHFQSRETTSTVITPQTSSLPVCTSTSATTNNSITTVSSTTSASTVNVGARKRKPAFTSSLSGLPRKLKDDYN